MIDVIEFWLKVFKLVFDIVGLFIVWSVLLVVIVFFDDIFVGGNFLVVRFVRGGFLKKVYKYLGCLCCVRIFM